MADSNRKPFFREMSQNFGGTCNDGIQGVRTGSREPVLEISARLANRF